MYINNIDDIRIYINILSYINNPVCCCGILQDEFVDSGGDGKKRSIEKNETKLVLNRRFQNSYGLQMFSTSSHTHTHTQAQRARCRH